MSSSKRQVIKEIPITELCPKSLLIKKQTTLPQTLQFSPLTISTFLHDLSLLTILTYLSWNSFLQCLEKKRIVVWGWKSFIFWSLLPNLISQKNQKTVCHPLLWSFFIASDTPYNNSRPSSWRSSFCLSFSCFLSFFSIICSERTAGIWYLEQKKC